MTRIEKDIEDNKETDANAAAAIEAFKEDAMSDDEDERRILTEEGQQTRLLRLLKSLTKMVVTENEFLGTRKLKVDPKADAKKDDVKKEAPAKGGVSKGKVGGLTKTKPKDLNDKKMKFGRTAKEGGRPGTVGDADRKEDGRRMTFLEMLN